MAYELHEDKNLFAMGEDSKSYKFTGPYNMGVTIGAPVKAEMPRRRLLVESVADEVIHHLTRDGCTTTVVCSKKDA
jgi:hypothetical protein